MTIVTPDIKATVSQPGVASSLEWRAGPNESLIADIRDLRLTVQAPARFVGDFRYSVLRQQQHGRGSIFAKVERGARERLHDAMVAAEQAASRLSPQDQHRLAHCWVVPVQVT